MPFELVRKLAGQKLRERGELVMKDGCYSGPAPLASDNEQQDGAPKRRA